MSVTSVLRRFNRTYTQRVGVLDESYLGTGRPLDAGGAERVAEIKRMWVDSGWRGAGLGGRILRHLEMLARDHGFTRVRLDTNEGLAEAIALYERAGYVRIDRYNDNPYAQLFFEKRL